MENIFPRYLCHSSQENPVWAYFFFLFSFFFVFVFVLFFVFIYYSKGEQFIYFPCSRNNKNKTKLQTYTSHNILYKNIQDSHNRLKLIMQISYYIQVGLQKYYSSKCACPIRLNASPNLKKSIIFRGNIFLPLIINFQLIYKMSQARLLVLEFTRVNNSLGLNIKCLKEDLDD